MTTEVVELPQRIEVNAEPFDVITYRRNYYACRGGCGRTGTLMMLPDIVSRANSPSTVERVWLVVVCEFCGYGWEPDTGPALRALRR